MNLFTECVTKKDDVLYFVSSDSNFIFSFDINTKSTEIITSIEGEKQFKDRLFGEILTWNDMFVLVPANAKNIWIVDSTFTNWEKIELEHPEVSLKFLCAKVVGDELYMIKHLYPYSVCLNLITKEKNKIEIEGKDFFTGVEYYNGELYFASCNSNRLYTYDLESKKISIHSLDFEKMSGISYDNGKFHLTTREGTGIAEMSCEKEIIKKIPLCNVLAIIPYNGRYYIPLSSENTLYEKENEELIFQYNSFTVKKIDQSIWWTIDKDANITLFDDKEKRIVEGTLNVTREHIAKLNKIKIRNDVYNELEIFDLEEYVRLLIAD